MTDSSTMSWKTKHFFRGLEFPDEMANLAEELSNSFYNRPLNRFDYHACKESKLYSQLQLMLRCLGDFNPEELTSDHERKAFWLNLYNLIVLYLVMLENVNSSVLELTRFFSSYNYQLKGLRISLDDIEHGILRNNTPGYFRFLKPLKRNNPACNHIMALDPRIHMAFYCAAKSSSTFRGYSSEFIEQELNIATCEKMEREVFINNSRLYLPKCFHWYSKDFGGKAGILNFISDYHPDGSLVTAINRHIKEIKIQWQDFDWSLNQL